MPTELPTDPPDKFRIFRRGLNTTSKGPLLFSPRSAQLVMEAYERAGVDVMIDLNHDSIDEEIAKHRVDALDARGWCKLAVVSGELWAINVTWTPDGEERIRTRKQRYISPVCGHEEDGTVTEIYNIALCAMPATHNAQPLVARKRIDQQVALRKQRYLKSALSLAQRVEKYRSAVRQKKG